MASESRREESNNKCWPGENQELSNPPHSPCVALRLLGYQAYFSIQQEAMEKVLIGKFTDLLFLSY